MARSILLPSSEETTVEIIFEDQKVEVELFELESYYISASKAAKESAKPWFVETQKLLKSKLSIELPTTQIALLWEFIQRDLDRLKKSLLSE